MKRGKTSKSRMALELFAEMDISAWACIELLNGLIDYIRARAAYEQTDVQRLAMRDVLDNPDPESAWFQEDLEDAFRAYREAKKQFEFATNRITKFRQFAQI